MQSDVFDIMRAAVTVARTREIKKLNKLHEALFAMYPGQEEQVRQAVRLWANHTHSAH